jgi:hypothetical protein
MAGQRRRREVTVGLADKFKDLRKKAEDAAVEHKDQIQQGVQKAAATADQKTGGKYHEQIQKAGARANTLLEGLADAQQKPPGEGGSHGPA